mgnify:CR=1 FL=1
MILADLGLEILSMKEAGVFEEIEEDGMSFEEKCRDQGESNFKSYDK